MTAVNLKLADAIFTTGSLKGIRLPNRRKLVGEYVFGVSAAESQKNRANPSKPLTLQDPSSQIVYDAVSAKLRSSATTGYGFLTGIAPADDATLILIRKGGAGVQLFAMGHASTWVGFRQFGTNNYGANGEPANSSGANRPSPANTDIYFEAVVLSRKNNQRGTGGFGKLYYYSAGVQQVATSAQLNTAAARGAWATTQIAIGSNQLTDSITTNNFNAYFAAIYQRSLSAAEIDEAFQSLKADYATRGVTVV
jgi:hypothetical protein